MRLFVAVEIPTEIRRKIADLVEALQPAAANIRWSRPEGLHITLKFLGEVPSAKVDAIKKTLSMVHLPASFRVAIQHAGYFPTERSPRVIWLGIESGPELAALASQIEANLEPLGFAKEKRPFEAHLTLGRVNPPGKITAVQQVLRGREPIEFGSFTATEFFLYESKLSRGGSVYSKINRFGIVSGA